MLLFLCVSSYVYWILIIPVLVEPRGGNQDDFDDTLKGYYNSIHQGGKRDVGRKRKGKNLGMRNQKKIDFTEKSEKGAAFLAVCRGKV